MDGGRREISMSFELKPAKSLKKNVRKIARNEMWDAREMLTGKHDPSEAVHEARLSFKKVRALLRMVRPAIGNKAYQKENNCFRDAARPLTEVRDARILIETLDKLAKHFHEQITDQSFAHIRKELQANLRSVRTRVLNKQRALAAAAAMVKKSEKRLKRWAKLSDDWSSIGKGLKNEYRRTHHAFSTAVADPSVKNLHEWRKQAKYLRYQLELLRPLWRERMEQLANEADKMADLLGDDHDLAVLQQRLAENSERGRDESETETRAALIERRRSELQIEAKSLGNRFFGESAGSFVRRLKGYWKAWRSETAE
jgi:CHAD domain-containing protein